MSVAINTPIQTSNAPRTNINEASKACGLAPACCASGNCVTAGPKRKANGYRSYSPHLVEDLKRMAELVKAGTPIRQLIVDGRPAGRSRPTARQPSPHPGNHQGSARAQAPGRGPPAKEVLEAIETRRAGQMQELISAARQVRPQDEAIPAWPHDPRHHRAARPRAGHGSRRRCATLSGRVDQLLRRYQAGDDALILSDDLLLAKLVSLLLNQRGIAARVGDKGSITVGGDAKPRAAASPPCPRKAASRLPTSSTGTRNWTWPDRIRPHPGQPTEKPPPTGRGFSRPCAGTQRPSGIGLGLQGLGLPSSHRRCRFRSRRSGNPHLRG